MLLSIITPTYNEAQNVEPFILAVKKAMKKCKDYEIIFVDDNSQDKTYEIVKLPLKNIIMLDVLEELQEEVFHQQL